MYSIDKIKVIIHGVKLEVVQALLDWLAAIIDKDLIYYESKSVSKCYRNFVYKGIYLGIDNNWNKSFSAKFKNIVVEYNPNKVSLDEFIVPISFLFNDTKKIEVMSFDLAMDIEVDISNLIVLKHHELQRMNILSHSTIETYYLGQFNENGFCRIYNKAKESKLNTTLTRIEIHFKNVGFLGYYDEILKVKLPNVMVIDNDIDASDTNKVLIIACYYMPHLLNILEKRKKKQIKELMKGKLKPIEISIEKIIETYKNFEFK